MRRGVGGLGPSLAQHRLSKYTPLFFPLDGPASSGAPGATDNSRAGSDAEKRREKIARSVGWRRVGDQVFVRVARVYVRARSRGLMKAARNAHAVHDPTSHDARCLYLATKVGIVSNTVCTPAHYNSVHCCESCGCVSTNAWGTLTGFRCEN